MKIAILTLACLAHTVLGQSQRNGRQTNSTILNVNSTAASSTHTMPIVCYYYGWAATRPDPASYDVDKIPGDLCTHVNFAYAGVAPNTWELDSQVPRYDADKGLYKKFTAIKEDYPKLKTLLSVGGWQHPNGVFSQMSSTPQNRQKFITSVLQWMKEYNLDGVDLAWPFPGVDYRGGGPQDKENYVQLAKELSKELRENGLMLTMEVPLSDEHLNPGYDIDELAKYVDWFNVHAYDLRGKWNGVTDVHSPLFPRDIDVGDQQKLNVKDGLENLVSRGAPKSKLVMGIPFFGRGFTLLDRSQHGLHAIINGNIPPNPGPFVKSSDVYSYFEICLFLKSGWTREFDDQGKAPYAYYNNQWIGYEDTESIKHKMNFLLREGYAGVYVFNNDMDDFRGLCGEPNILLKTIRNSLNQDKNDIAETL
uniref:Putative catalytically inactive chitinase-like lectins n=1 Tax=Ixodes ricinus TaxID=34613 RepID=V5ICA0_IXORI